MERRTIKMRETVLNIADIKKAIQRNFGAGATDRVEFDIEHISELGDEQQLVAARVYTEVTDSEGTAE